MSGIFEWVWLLAQFLIGINLVVFIHELGHYLAARWAGIKVERFALGMGPRLIGFVLGETDYCLCAFPIGGYVKMLGQDDFKPLDENQQPDPRSYNAAPVGKRFVVIAAGVTMNVLLAPILFLILIMVGMNFPAPYVGGVTPDYPASETVIQWQGEAPPTAENPAEDKTKWIGLAAGDRITAIDGRAVTRFGDLKMAAILAGPDDKFTVDFTRKINNKEYAGQTVIGTKQQADLGAPIFGIVPASSRTVGQDRNVITDTPFEPGDEVVAIGNKPVNNSWQLASIIQNLTGQAVVVRVKRDDKTVDITVHPSLMSRPDVVYLSDGTRLEAWPVAIDDAKQEVTLQTPAGQTRTLPQSQIAGGAGWTMLDILGLRPRLKVDSVSKGSPADKAGIKPGDIIISYAERPNPTIRQFRQLSEKIGDAKTRITVLRAGQRISFEITPAQRNGSALIGIGNASDLANLTVASVRPGSPAAKAGVQSEAKILAVNGQPVKTWLGLFETLKKLPGQEIKLTCQLGDLRKTYSLGKLTEAAFQPDDYALTLFGPTLFEPMTVHIVHRNPAIAAAWSIEETYRLILSSYRSIYSMILGRVSASKQARGPVGIAVIAMETARRGLSSLVYLMSFISLALAVFNFLPLPVLDGGHAVLLIIEKVRGRPLPVKIVNAIQMVGLVLILGLAVLLTYQDIAREIADMW